MLVSVELFIFTSALKCVFSGVLIFCTEEIFSAFVASLSNGGGLFSAKAKAPTEERGILLYAVLEDRIIRVKSSLREIAGRCEDKKTLRNITDKNADNNIKSRAGFKFMAITEVFFKKINSFHLIYIDLFEKICDNI